MSLDAISEDAKQVSVVNNLARFLLWLLSSAYANILKYHIQGMPTNIILQVFI
jgi:hypothetical protein